VESKNGEGRVAHTGSCDGDPRLSTDDAYELLSKPFWFRLLLAIPEPELQTVWGFLILPSAIMAVDVLGFMYIALTVHSPLVWLVLACLLSPLIIVSASTQAHRFWRYIQNHLMAQRTFDFEVTLKEYVALVKRKD